MNMRNLAVLTRADKLGSKGKKSKATTPFGIGQWERSDENLDLVDEDDPYETEATNYAVSRLEEYYPGASKVFNIGATGVRSVRAMDPREVFYVLGLDASEKGIVPTRLEYTTEGLENKKEIALVVPGIEPWGEWDEVHFGDAGGGRAVAWIRFGETRDKDGNRVLVIDEIQSNRHQEGREKGYKKKEVFPRATMENVEIDRSGDLVAARYNGMNDRFMFSHSESDADILQHLNEMIQSGRFEENLPGVPDAPFEKNWHELAMKRMLRYAAERGYDKVAWTKGAQQAERYGLGSVVKRIESEPYEAQSASESDGHDLFIEMNDGTMYEMFVQPDGTINSGGEVFDGKRVGEVFGKEIGARIMEATEPTEISGDGLRVGGEGMRGFYDEILPRYMNKYGKKWGVTVGEVELPEVEESGRRMWSVDVTPEMKESVLEGQVMFSLVEEYNRTAPTDNEEAKSRIRDVIAISKVVKDKVFRTVVGRVTDRQLSDFKATGLDITNEYVHSVENSLLIHNQQQHGNEEKERRRGQIAITEKDYELIPEILEDYDNVVLSPNKDRRGRDVLIYKKEYPDGTVYYLEEVRERRKSLAFETMYKKENGTGSPDGPMTSSLPLTSETTSSNPSTDKVSDFSSNLQGKGGENSSMGVDNVGATRSRHTGRDGAVDGGAAEPRPTEKEERSGVEERRGVEEHVKKWNGWMVPVEITTEGDAARWIYGMVGEVKRGNERLTGHDMGLDHSRLLDRDDSRGRKIDTAVLRLKYSHLAAAIGVVCNPCKA